MVARRRHHLLEGLPPIITHQQPRLAPRFVVVQSIQGMTRGDTRFATAAFIEIDLKRVLLPGRRLRKRNEFLITRTVDFVAFVPAREIRHHRGGGLFSENPVQQRLHGRDKCSPDATAIELFATQA
jgi:hypothetical protein